MRSLCSILAVVAISFTAHAAENLSVLNESTSGIAAGKQLELWLKHEFYQHVDRRTAAFEKMLKSETAGRAWQEERREFFRKQIGEFPERTPLNAQVVGKLQGKGYSVEKILLESRPGFHITGNLYLPETSPPWPAVLVPCGHSHEGKAVGQYQRISILLAKHGMAAMCYDPVGQGERYQILDTKKQQTTFEDAKHIQAPHPSVRLLCTTEHTMIGLGSALLGGNVAQFRIWDGMRVIDYLQSRSDIRGDKIGCTGNSGGGTETAYLMALDDRIVAASPGCYLTTFRRLIDSKGPQDGEQNIFAQISFGMDEADYCIMRAPKPTLICAGTRDATFDFRGTWELFLEAKRFYARLGRTDAIDINAPDAPHGFTLQQREAVVSWMHRWLLGKEKVVREVDSLPDTISDEDLRKYNTEDWTPEQLYCTPQGQVLFLPGERSVFQIHSEIADSLRQPRSSRWLKLGLEGKQKLIRDTIAATEAKQLSAPKFQIVGKIERETCTIHKLVLTIDERLQLPALGFVPKQPNGSATLYLHGSSMAADAAPGGPIETLVKQGQLVLAPELRGIGETETGHDKREFGYGRFGKDNLEIFLAYLIGKSYVGMRTDDVHSWNTVLRQWSRDKSVLGSDPKAIHLTGIGEAAIPALHAAALGSHEFKTVALRQMLPTWEEIVRAPETHDQWVNVVHGALKHYDLPDLIELVGKDKVHLQDPINAMKQVVK